MVTQLDEGFQIATRAAAQIQNAEWRIRLYIFKQRLDILADVMRARPFPECARALIVMIQRYGADMPQFLRV